MRIHFTKMHGAGNDFVVIDAREQPLALEPKTARHIADRRLGIGCDQLLLLVPAEAPGADFGYRIFNASGGEVQQCGNGARALARFARPAARAGDGVTMQSPVGLVRARFEEGAVAVDMGPARFEPAALPFVQDERSTRYARRVAGHDVEFGAVSMGNPHAIIAVEDVSCAAVAELGAALEQHPDFPQGVNVGFMQVVDEGAIALRVWERGVGETLACGTGACAAVAVAHDQGLTGSHVSVTLPGGELMVNFDNPDAPVWLTGPATIAFEGHIDL